MTAADIELARYADASAARAAARTLLTMGITPAVEREDDDHVLRVAAPDAARAAAALGLEPPEGVEGEGSLGVSDGGPAAPPPTSGIGPSGGAPVEPVADALEVDDQGFVVVAVTRDETETRAVAAKLLEQGIGVELGGAIEAGYVSPLMGDADAQVVRVLELDAARAQAILGTDPPRRLPPPPEAALPAPPAEATPSGPDDSPAALTPSPPRRRGRGHEPAEVHEYLGGRLKLTKRQLWTAIIVYLLALVLVPLTFYYLTIWFLDPGGGDPTDTIPGFTDTTVD